MGRWALEFIGERLLRRMLGGEVVDLEVLARSVGRGSMAILVVGAVGSDSRR